jgi:NAD(P)-dependent dehydrogenase (short-subunit alcohol dehydrogenase family)
MTSRRHWLAAGAAWAAGTTLGQSAFAQQAAPNATRGPDVVFVPTPNEIVDEMLSIASVGTKDVLYDLGSGDGRIPITAAKRFGTPKEFGDACAYLCSAQAGFISGQLLQLDGGSYHGLI